MTFERHAGREPITIVEIDQDICVNSYGVSPCTAAIGATGERKCFNTLASCQDTGNFSLGDGSPATEGKLTLRFCASAENLPRDIILIPSLIEATSQPTEINVASSDKNMSPLGRRASVTITLRDHPYHDRLVDPYWSERDYDPMSQGTFWSKWKARNPYYQGRALRVRDGYIGQALEDMRVRHYIIEKIEGPSNDRIKITAKDPLKLLESARKQVPAPSTGTLSILMDAETNSIVPLLPAGVGSEYPASGIARIGSELVSYNRSGDDVTITARGLRGTAMATHKAGDTFQDVYVVDNERVDDVLNDLLTAAGIDPSFIPTDDWAQEASLWSSVLTVSAWVTSPTGVDKLVSEILQQTVCYIWWEPVEQEIKFRVLRPRLPQIDSDPIAFTDDANFIADSFAIADRPDERVSQTWVYYDQINPVEGDDEKNFAQLKVLIDADAESASQYGESRIDVIFARWLSDGAPALTIAARKLNRYRHTPRSYTFDLDAKDSSLAAGDLIDATHRAMVGLTGEPETRTLQIISIDEFEPGHKRRVEARDFDLIETNGGFIVANDAPVYGSATDEQKAYGAWIAPNTGEFDNGDPAYRII